MSTILNVSFRALESNNNLEIQRTTTLP